MNIKLKVTIKIAEKVSKMGPPEYSEMEFSSKIRGFLLDGGVSDIVLHT